MRNLAILLKPGNVKFGEIQCIWVEPKFCWILIWWIFGIHKFANISPSPIIPAIWYIEIMIILLIFYSYNIGFWVCQYLCVLSLELNLPNCIPKKAVNFDWFLLQFLYNYKTTTKNLFTFHKHLAFQFHFKYHDTVSYCDSFGSNIQYYMYMYFSCNTHP